MSGKFHGPIIRAATNYLNDSWKPKGDWAQDVATLDGLLANMLEGYATQAFAIRSLMKKLPRDSDEYKLLHDEIKKRKKNTRGLKDFLGHRFNEVGRYLDCITDRIDEDIGEIRVRFLGYFGDENPLTDANLQDLLEDEDSVMEIMEGGTYVDPRSNQYKYNFFVVELLGKYEIKRIERKRKETRRELELRRLVEREKENSNVNVQANGSEHDDSPSDDEEEDYQPSPPQSNSGVSVFNEDGERVSVGRASVASSTRSVESDYLSPSVSYQDNYSPPTPKLGRELEREKENSNVNVQANFSNSNESEHESDESPSDDEEEDFQPSPSQSNSGVSVSNEVEERVRDRAQSDNLAANASSTGTEEQSDVYLELLHELRDEMNEANFSNNEIESISFEPAAEEQKIDYPPSPSQSNSSASVFNEEEDLRVSDGAQSVGRDSLASSTGSVQSDYCSTDEPFVDHLSPAQLEQMKKSKNFLVVKDEHNNTVIVPTEEDPPSTSHSRDAGRSSDWINLNPTTKELLNKIRELEIILNELRSEVRALRTGSSIPTQDDDGDEDGDDDDDGDEEVNILQNELRDLIQEESNRRDEFDQRLHQVENDLTGIMTANDTIQVILNSAMNLDPGHRLFEIMARQSAIIAGLNRERIAEITNVPLERARARQMIEELRNRQSRNDLNEEDSSDEESDSGESFPVLVRRNRGRGRGRQG